MYCFHHSYIYYHFTIKAIIKTKGTRQNLGTNWNVEAICKVRCLLQILEWNCWFPKHGWILPIEQHKGKLILGLFLCLIDFEVRWGKSINGWRQSGRDRKSLKNLWFKAIWQLLVLSQNGDFLQSRQILKDVASKARGRTMIALPLCFSLHQLFALQP